MTHNPTRLVLTPSVDNAQEGGCREGRGRGGGAEQKRNVVTFVYINRWN